MDQQHGQNNAVEVQEVEVQSYENVEFIASSVQDENNIQSTIDQTLLHISNIQQEQNQQIQQLLGNHQKIIDSLTTVTANQKKITNRVASISVQIDELYKEIATSNAQQKVVPLNESHDFERERFRIEPISNIAKLEDNNVTSIM